jgi:hypothetical protein
MKLEPKVEIKQAKPKMFESLLKSELKIIDDEKNQNEEKNQKVVEKAEVNKVLHAVEVLKT